MTRREPNEAVAKLQAMAALFDGAATRAFTVLDHEHRQQDAHQLRVIAAMAARRNRTKADDAWIELWLSSAERALLYYDLADMAVVHGTRSSRRQRRAAELGTEAGA